MTARARTVSLPWSLAAGRPLSWGHPAAPIPAGTALLCYSALVAFLARHLLPRLNTSIVGPLDGDNFWYAWSVWHFQRAVLAGQDPNYTDQLRALTTSVPVFTDGFFNQLLALPLQLFLSPLGAYDTTIVLSYVLAGLTMYLLASAFTRSWIACLVAGLVFTFSTYHFARGTMHLGLLTVQWLPFCAWRLILFFRDPRTRNALLAGVSIGLVPWSDVYYAPYFLLPFGACLLIARAVADRRWFLRWENLARSALALAVAAVVALPSVYGYLLAAPDIRAAVAAEATDGSKTSLSADLTGFVLPDPYTPMVGHFVTRFFSHGVFPARSVFLGVPALVLTALCVCLPRGRTRAAAGWLAMAAIAVVLALGPVLQVAGSPVIELPFYRLAFGWRPLSDFRSPSEIGILAMLAVSALSALGVAALLATVAKGRRSRSAVGAGLVGLVLVGLLPSAVSAYSIASFEVPTPSFYEQIAASPDAGLLLDVPTYIASSTYLQTVHGKRLVGGILPREPAGTLTALDQVPYLWRIDSWEPLPGPDPTVAGGRPTDVFPLPDFVEGLRENGISWVVLHRFLCADRQVNAAYYCPELPHYEDVRSFLLGSLGAPFADDVRAAVMAWHVTEAPAAPVPDPLYRLGAGWAYGLDLPVDGGARRLASPAASLFLTVRSPRSLHLTIRASAYVRPTRVEVLLNGRSVGGSDLAPDHPSDIALGPVELATGRNVLMLRSSNGCVRAGTDPRQCWSVAVERIAAA